VECNGNSDCKVGTKPVCDANQCRACQKDLDCAGALQAGVCGLDGSCPAEDAVIHLQNRAELLDDQFRGDGTARVRPPAHADDAALLTCRPPSQSL
jgi:hypothetical protein